MEPIYFLFLFPLKLVVGVFICCHTPKFGLNFYEMFRVSNNYKKNVENTLPLRVSGSLGDGSAVLAGMDESLLCGKSPLTGSQLCRQHLYLHRQGSQVPEDDAQTLRLLQPALTSKKGKSQRARTRAKGRSRCNQLPHVSVSQTEERCVLFQECILGLKMT